MLTWLGNRRHNIKGSTSQDVSKSSPSTVTSLLTILRSILRAFSVSSVPLLRLIFLPDVSYNPGSTNKTARPLSLQFSMHHRPSPPPKLRSPQRSVFQPFAVSNATSVFLRLSMACSCLPHCLGSGSRRKSRQCARVHHWWLPLKISRPVPQRDSTLCVYKP